MRILAIRGEDLASLAGPFEVDLCAGPLAEANLFAIHGPTGAGKSTLLDAMCLALFAKTPRLEGRGVQVGRADVPEKDRVASGDPRSLLRHGSGEGFAEVDFAGRNGRRYRARWAVRRARRKAEGRLQKVEWSLEPLDGEGTRASEKLKQVGAAIEAELGLTYEQFCRSVLLPQGAFAAFLKAPEKDRAGLLELVTGTDLYGRLSVAAHKRASRARKDLDEREASLGAIERLDATERAALEEAGAAALRERTHLLARRGALERVREAVAACAARVEEVAQAASRVEALQVAAEAAAEVATSAQAAKDAAVQAAKDLLASQAGTRRELALARELDKELAAFEERVTARARALSECQEGLRSAGARQRTGQERVEASKTREAAAREWLDAHGELAAIAEDFAVLRRDLEALAELPALREAAARGQELVEERERGRAAAEVADVAATEALVEAQKRRDEARRSLQETKDPEPELARLRDLRDLRRQVADATRRAAEAGEAAAAAEREAEEARVGGEAGEQEAQVARARAEEAAEGVARTRRALELEDRRDELVAGEPCPLCGAREHPYSQGGGPGARALAEQEDRARELGVAARGLEKTVADLRARQEQATRVASQARRREQGARAEGQVPAEAWRQAERPASLPPEADASGVDAALDAWEEELEVARLARVAGREAVDELQARFEALRAAREGTREALEEARLLRVEAEQAAARAATERGEREAAETRLEALLRERLDAAQAARVRREPLALARDLGARLEARRAREKDLQEASKTREMAAAEVDQASREVREGELRQTRLQEELGVATSARDTARARRQQLLAGRAVDAVEAELEGAAEAHRRAQQEAEGAASKATQEKAVAATRLEEARTRAAAAQAGLAAAQQERDSARAAAPADPEGRSSEEEVAALEASVRALDEEAGARRERLEQDAAAAARQQELEARLQPLRAEARRWGQLDDLIGSADGGAFRTFAQGLTLDHLLGEANLHLRELAPRYRLDRVPGRPLSLQVLDRDLGDEIRAVEGLSGGETFLVSLALALGLSGLAAERTLVESLFVDEGFGTLDPVSLDRAVEVLENLETGGRQVGVISHVAGLAERIGAAVEVVKCGPGRSRIVVHGPRGTLAP